MARSYTKVHDVKPRMALDRVFFIGAFALGVVGGVALKLNGAHPFLAAGFSAAVLIGYALLIWTSGRLQLEPEAIGDNCYYLGFLFTLASLAVTLWQVAEPPPDTTQAELLPGIISGFGVALSSTIVGVFLRVLMMQMRPDFMAAEHEARTSLTTAMRDFRGQLSASNRDMKSFAVESIQQAQERDERIRASTEEFVTEAQKQIIETQTQTLQVLEQSASQALRKISDEASQAFSRNAISIEEPLKSLGVALEGLQDHVSSVEEEVFRTEKSVRSFNLEIERLHEELGALVKAFSEMAEDNDGTMRKFSSNLSRAATRIESKTIPTLKALEVRLANLPRQAELWDARQSELAPDTLEVKVHSPAETK